MIKETVNYYMAWFNIKLKKSPTLMEAAFLAEDHEAWVLATDLYLGFWLWYESLPKKVKKTAYVSHFKDFEGV